MKKILPIIVLFSILAGTAFAQGTVKTDEEAIKETVLNYAEGWYSGNAERMGKALSTDLAKRGVVPSRDGKGIQLLPATYTQMLEWTKMQPNTLKDNPGVIEEVKILDLGINMATVKCTTRDFVDVLHLMKIDNEWKILNAIWEPNYSKMQKK